MKTTALVIGGTAIASAAAGVWAERATQDKLNQEKAVATPWVAQFRETFADEMRADRQRNQELRNRLEDYVSEHGQPTGAVAGRGGAGWHANVVSDREGFWAASVLGGILGAGMVGGLVAAVAAESRSRAGVMAGGMIAAAGAAYAAGAIASTIAFDS